MSRIFLNKENFVTMMDELAKSCQLVHSNVNTDMSSGQVSNTYVFKNDDDNIIFQHIGIDYISIWSKNAKMWIINADNLKIYDYILCRKNYKIVRVFRHDQHIGNILLKKHSTT